MIVVGLGGFVHESPTATGWTIDDGTLTLLTVGEGGGVEAEHGVFAKWDYVYDEADVTMRTNEPPHA